MANSDFVKHYFEWCEFLQDRDKPQFRRTLETRTRRGDITDALRFRVYDPLWMLSRQWQLGEFKGNDAGTAMNVRCRIVQSPVMFGDGDESGGTLPFEPQVEQVARGDTPLGRLEAAAHFVEMLPDFAPFNKQAERERLLEDLARDIPFYRGCDDIDRYASIGSEEVRLFALSRNKRLTDMEKAFRGRAFDGQSLYSSLFGVTRPHKPGKEPQPLWGITLELAHAYVDWYSNRYKHGTGKFNKKSLGYQCDAVSSTGRYTNDYYGGGRLSWYSFDTVTDAPGISGFAQKKTEMAIPTPVSYPGAPNKRLWEFEDRKVFLGNSTGMQAKGNVAFLQYATMYGNDWMIFPVRAEFGQHLRVEEIVVYDTFGRRSVISTPAEAGENKARTFGQTWQMFTNADVKHEGAAPGLLFPPVFPRTMEGEPLEQVNFLRDEMANMVWAVETRLPDGLNSSRDANLLAAEVEQFVEESYEKEVEKARLSVRADSDGRAVLTSDRNSDYKFTLMSGVPYNWIPFVPQHVGADEKSAYSGFLGGREIVLRRGKMPVYFDGQYYPVRPLSSLLFVNHRYDPPGTLKEEPMFVNEEEVQGVGTQVVKNCQRARWLYGKTYTWVGYSKQIKYTQGNSGLKFDELEDPTK